MGGFLLRKLGAAIVVLLLASILVFLGGRALPGDPATALGAENRDPAAMAAIRHHYGLDQPLPIQYVKWLGLALQGDLGRDQRELPVAQTIVDRLPTTIELSLLAIFVGIVIGIPAGIIAAVRQRKTADYVATSAALVGLSVPHFWLGLMMISLFAVNLHWLPASGYVPFTEDPLENLRDLILPMIALGSASVAVNFRQVRASMIEVLSQDYIRAARAKGLSERRINYRHAFPNALLPLLTLVGLQAGAILAGAVIVETIFLWPGVGQLAVSSILSKDYPVVQGVVLLSALSYILINLLVDLSYTVVDPRISYGAQR